MVQGSFKFEGVKDFLLILSPSVFNLPLLIGRDEPYLLISLIFLAK